MRPLRPRAYAPTSGALLIVAALLLGPSAAGAAEPFYERLLQDGLSAAARGDHAEARQNLRIACFGLLEEPGPLAGCLTHLALAQAATGDEEAFNETFDRILEVERRFGSFSDVALDPATRERFDAALERWVPYEVLSRAPVFAEVAQRKLEARIAALPPAERREELKKRLAGEPGHLPWRALLAQLELEAGELRAARESAEAVLDEDARHPLARCVHGRALAALGECEQALLDLPACREPAAEVTVTEAALRCHVRLREWQGAEELLAALAPEKRGRRSIRRLEREVEEGRREDARTARAEAETAAEETAGGAPEGGEEAGSEEAVAEGGADEPPQSETVTLPAAVSAQLDQVRELLHSRPTRQQLEDALGRTREVADRYPDNLELQFLVAEVAYRLGRWQETIAYFGRGGDLGPSRPERQFYYAVALYENGDREAAAHILRRCLPLLQQTDFVRGYAAKILGR